jgi:mRNA interferase MazF
MKRSVLWNGGKQWLISSMRAEPQPGEVYFVDLGMSAKPRRVLIVSVQDPNSPLAVVTGLSLTTRYHQSKYEVALPKLPWMREQSHVNAQSLSGYKVIELQRLSGKLDASVMQNVQQAIRAWLAI